MTCKPVTACILFAPACNTTVSTAKTEASLVALRRQIREEAEMLRGLPRRFIQVTDVSVAEPR